MSHRLVAGELAGLAIAACLIEPVGFPAAAAFPLVTIALLAALGRYGPPDAMPAAWDSLATVTAVTGGLAATTIAAGAAADPRQAIALWACAVAALRARRLALRLRPGSSSTPHPQ